MPQVRNYYLFLPLIVLFFVFSVGYQIPFYALIPEVAPAGKRGAYTVFTGLLRFLGFALILGLGSLAWRRDPAYPFYITALFVAISSLITVFSVREENNLSRRVKRTVSSFLDRARVYLADLREKRNILLFLIAQFFWWLGLGAVIPFVTILMKEYYGIDISQFLRLSPLAFLAELVPKGREGEFYGLDTLSITASQAPAALLGGAVIDWFGYSYIFLFAAAGLAIATVFMLIKR